MTLDKEASEFIESNIGLLYEFMHRYHLDDDYYGLLAIGYINAAAKYLSDPKLQQYAFSTILWYRLRYEISHARRRENTRLQTVPLEQTTGPPGHWDDESFDLLWNAIEGILTPRQLEVLCLRYHGMTNREIAEQFGISQVAVERLFSRIRKRISENYN